ncbi:tyrosine-type recombinase/integrase [Thermaerobacter subterraneus]|uniref:tyrosine-type recombinase/integrase n=1 Tax=Thermaerobacter subterraneus TaxID=175696 RepID=UPI001FA6D8C8|nr:tyrosine-type recombinase/integrase [Thermaerobacter subterraneus]
MSTGRSIFSTLRSSLRLRGRGSALWRASAHKLRHTFGTRLPEAGVDLLVIKDLLGHATVATTPIYAHVAQRRPRESVRSPRCR